MADTSKHIASAAAASRQAQPGLTLAEGVFSEGESEQEFDGPMAAGLAALGLDFGNPETDPDSDEEAGAVETPRKPKTDPKERRSPKAGKDASDADEESDEDTDEEVESEETDEEAEASGHEEENEESETETDSEKDDEEEGEESTGSTGRDKRRERFAKLTAKLHEKDALLEERESRIAELEEALESTSSAKAQPTAADPLADIEDESTLAERIRAARRTQRWCLGHQDGGTPPGSEEELTAEQVQAWLDWSDTVLDAETTARERLKSRAVNAETARQRYPDQFERGSAAARERTRLLKDIPGLNAHPERDLIIGRLLRAAEEEKREEGGKGKFVFMPLNGTRPKAGVNGKNGAEHREERGENEREERPAPEGGRRRVPVRSPEHEPTRRLRQAADSGVAVDAEALLLGGAG